MSPHLGAGVWVLLTALPFISWDSLVSGCFEVILLKALVVRRWLMTLRNGSAKLEDLLTCCGQWDAAFRHSDPRPCRSQSFSFPLPCLSRISLLSSSPLGQGPCSAHVAVSIQTVIHIDWPALPLLGACLK